MGEAVKFRPVEEGLQHIIDAFGFTPDRITYVKQDKPILTVDWTEDGKSRVIYSRGFLVNLGIAVEE